MPLQFILRWITVLNFMGIYPIVVISFKTTNDQGIYTAINITCIQWEPWMSEQSFFKSRLCAFWVRPCKAGSNQSEVEEDCSLTQSDHTSSYHHDWKASGWRNVCRDRVMLLQEGHKFNCCISQRPPTQPCVQLAGKPRPLSASLL